MLRHTNRLYGAVANGSYISRLSKIESKIYDVNKINILFYQNSVSWIYDH